MCIVYYMFNFTHLKKIEVMKYKYKHMILYYDRVPPDFKKNSTACRKSKNFESL